MRILSLVTLALVLAACADAPTAPPAAPLPHRTASFDSTRFANWPPPVTDGGGQRFPGFPW